MAFHGPTAWQERNRHDLLADFRDELPGYLHNAAIAQTLAQANLRPGLPSIPQNMQVCYAAMVSAGFIDNQELPLLAAWLDDVAKVGAGPRP